MTQIIQFREAFARKIIQLRKDKDKTQAEVARALEIKQRTYAAYEERRAEPGLTVLKKMAKFYCQTLDELVKVD